MSDPTGMPAPAQTPKMGLTSSEFISMVMTMVGLCLGAVPAQYAPLVAALVGLYVACRTLLKVIHTMGYAKSIPDLPEAPQLPAGTIQTTIVPK